MDAMLGRINQIIGLDARQAFDSAFKLASGQGPDVAALVAGLQGREPVMQVCACLTHQALPQQAVCFGATVGIDAAHHAVHAALQLLALFKSVSYSPALPDRL